MIYVIGSLNMDTAVTLDKFPRSGETVIARSTLVSPGGKGANQAAAVAKLGGDCTMIGKVGDDRFGKIMAENLRSFGVDTRYITVTEKAPSGSASVWIHRRNNRIAVDSGANAFLTYGDVDEGLSGAKPGDILMTQLESPPEIVSYALERGKRKGMITMLNPAPAAGMTQEIYGNCEIITPNETETEILTGIKPDCEVNIALAVRKFRSFGASVAVITLGAAGSAVAFGREITLVPAYKVKVADTTAAGDTFVGALALKLSQKCDIVTAAKFATRASAVKITRWGAVNAIPSASEVEESLL